MGSCNLQERPVDVLQFAFIAAASLRYGSAAAKMSFG
jgi:hypothetical protein